MRLCFAGNEDPIKKETSKAGRNVRQAAAPEAEPGQQRGANAAGAGLPRDSRAQEAGPPQRRQAGRGARRPRGGPALLGVRTARQATARDTHRRAAARKPGVGALSRRDIRN